MLRLHPPELDLLVDCHEERADEGEHAIATTHWPPLSETVVSRRWNMPSSTAAIVRNQPSITHPIKGNNGADHIGSRSRRITRPLFTPARATTANAIVIDTDPTVVLGSSGPYWSKTSAGAAMSNPPITHLTVWARLAIFVPGTRGGRCMTLGSGTSTMKPTTTVAMTKNFANNSCIGKRATPPLTLRMVASNINWSTEDSTVSCNFT